MKTIASGCLGLLLVSVACVEDAGPMCTGACRDASHGEVATLDDAGPEVGVACVTCAGAPFPHFENRCQATAECVTAVHQLDCCGARIALGIAATQQAAFAQAEGDCQVGIGPCTSDRPVPRLRAQDGQYADTPDGIGVYCRGGVCATFVR